MHNFFSPCFKRQLLCRPTRRLAFFRNDKHFASCHSSFARLNLQSCKRHFFTFKNNPAMKKTIFTLLLSFSCCWLVAQCPTGDVTFSTQGQIDSFQINYPGCTDIPGNVLISGVDITNLQGLIGLESVSGCLLIKENPVLTSLHGLEYLSLVGGCYIGSPNLERSYGLEISNNAMLVSISELENLKSVEGCITVKGNPLLTTLNHLDSLVSVGYCGQFGSGWVFPYRYSIGILGNKNLKTIGGVGILDSIFSLYIIANDSLVSLSGLEGLQTISGRLVVEDNASLPNFNGLNNLQSVGELKVESNQSLKNFEGLENLKNIYCLQISPPGYWLV